MDLKIFVIISMLISTGTCFLLFDKLNNFMNYEKNFHFKPEVANFGSYDFVIIGAGSGGSVLANRLTENPNWTVLLLEAGGDESFLTDIPLMAAIWHITDYNWGYKSPPHEEWRNRNDGYCLSMKEGKCNWPRGKVLGGTSVINFMIYMRGDRRDYDSWSAQGNPGWSYEEVLPYFLKSENSKLSYQEDEYHGRGGYLDVTNPPFVSKLREPFLQSAEEMGYSVGDCNGQRLAGFCVVQANLRRGRRVSASKAFLNPIMYRKNLHISKFSHVTKIIIDENNRVATGVEFMKNGQKYRVRAKKEVLLSAGAFNSPQILMLSGIGPRDHLESLGINVLEDLPVGENLQDHISQSTLTFLVNDTVTIVESRVATNLVNTFNYLFKGTGPLTVPGGAEAIAFINTKNVFRNEMDGNRTWRSEGDVRTNTVVANEDVPDIELVLGLGALTGDTSGSLRSLFGVTDEFYQRVFKDYEGQDAFSIVPVLLQPKSKGRVQLRSTNPFDWPIIEANYFQEEDDLDTMVRGIKEAIKLASSRPFKKFNTTLFPRKYPGCENLAFNSDKYWACFARHATVSLGHFTGTCKMAPRQNFGVVDSKLNVYGIRNLRVVDASIMPTITRGHTNAPIIMIGEKASDFIKEKWRNAGY